MHPWIGKQQTRLDRMDPARAEALHATLGLAGVVTTPLPPFWHHIYFWDAEPPTMLGPDAHIKVGHGVIPDLGLPHRMWAGGALTFHAPLRTGRPAEKVTTLDAVTEKTGRSGKLAFVTLRHEMRQDNRLCVTERQDLVYRGPIDPDRRPLPPKAPDMARVSEVVQFDPTLLFRYSALTFNGHRIHYDLDYARDVEGYAGLVVHGPLLAQLLMLFAERSGGPLTGFEFRATAPLKHFEQAKLCLGEGGRMWVRGPDGRQCMSATAAWDAVM